MSAPFLIFALPRSRTAWLANFLTHGMIRCGHEMLETVDPLDLCETLHGIRLSYFGNSDTAQSIFWPEIRRTMPDVATVVIRRKESDVVDSLRRVGLSRHADYVVSRLAPHVDRACEHHRAFVVDFEDLSAESTCRAIQTHVAPGTPFDRWRWNQLQSYNVQVTQNIIDKIKSKAGDRVCHQVTDK